MVTEAGENIIMEDATEEGGSNNGNIMLEESSINGPMIADMPTDLTNHNNAPVAIEEQGHVNLIMVDSIANNVVRKRTRQDTKKRKPGKVLRSTPTTFENMY